MTDSNLRIDGVFVPGFLYGTAWKEQETQRLTELALRQGFRGIDTANQRRHYDEASVGLAIASSIANGVCTRDDLFIQTKFTFRAGQDHRLPYDPQAPIASQVEQSFASSLEHLGIDVIDSYVLHGPSVRFGLSETDWEAWRAMEALQKRGVVRLLGVSNVTLEQLEQLCGEAQVPPRFVQNRCYAALGWDHAVRAFCIKNGLIYQGFSLLTANRAVMDSLELTRIAERHKRPAAAIVFRFALEAGMLPLTGTGDPKHMSDDLSVFDFRLEPEEVRRIERLAVQTR